MSYISPDAIFNGYNASNSVLTRFPKKKKNTKEKEREVKLLSLYSQSDANDIKVTYTFFFYFLPRDAIHSVDYAVAKRMSVSLSVPMSKRPNVS